MAVFPRRRLVLRGRYGGRRRRLRIGSSVTCGSRRCRRPLRAAAAASEAGVVEGLGDEVLRRDGEFFLEVVPGEANDLHPVQKRARDVVLDIRRAHEEAPREIDGDVEVVVEEGVVLRGVEELEQRRGRVAAAARAELVDLVEQDERVARLRLLERLERLARHGAHVGPPVPLDLGDVVEAADRKPREVAAERFGDRRADRGLADARRADEAEDLALDGPNEGADGDELQDAVLDVVHAVVLGVQDVHRLGDVEGLGLVAAPRDRREPVEVRPRHVELGRVLLKRLQLGELFLDRALRFLRDDATLRMLVLLFLRLGSFLLLVLALELGVVQQRDLVSVFLDERLFVVLLDAELLLDRLELLVEHEGPLLRRDLLLDLLRDLLLQLGEFALLADQFER
mmetsp:Transcript_10990/g.44545  ORF Transcript_10990/g.44545 Transcript_10990/m.44545 type:complete len:398 (-) Transcript_10990:243-1436(-)